MLEHERLCGGSAVSRYPSADLFEYEVQAELEREFLRVGCCDVGYGSIVAAGSNGARMAKKSCAA